MSPWFTRKVMNRLPPRSRNVMAAVEYAIYLIGIVITAVYIHSYWTTTIAPATSITVSQLMVFGTLVGILVTLIYLTLSPLTYRH